MQASDKIQQIKIKHPSTFIVSSGRSGTTLLVALLNASDQIYIPYESDFVARAYPFYHDYKYFSSDDYQKIAKLFLLTSQADGWGLSYRYILNYLTELQPQTFAEVCSAIYCSFHEKEGTAEKLHGIKCPVLISSIKQIHDVYPEAKIIHIVRDGRDVYLSYRKIHESSEIKFGPKGVISSALYWIDGLRRIEEASESEICELRYEDFIQETDRELSRISKFLGIKYDFLVRKDYFKRIEKRKIASRRVIGMIHQKVGQKIDSRNSQKYLTEMSKAERFVFELITIPFLKKYGYACEYPLLSTNLLLPFRSFCYFTARKINNWRYDKRDKYFYHQTDEQC